MLDLLLYWANAFLVAIPSTSHPSASNAARSGDGNTDIGLGQLRRCTYRFVTEVLDWIVVVVTIADVLA